MFFVLFYLLPIPFKIFICMFVSLRVDEYVCGGVCVPWGLEDDAGFLRAQFQVVAVCMACCAEAGI